MTSDIRRRNKTNVQATVIDKNSSKKGPVLQENTHVDFHKFSKILFISRKLGSILVALCWPVGTMQYQECIIYQKHEALSTSSYQFVLFDQHNVY